MQISEVPLVSHYQRAQEELSLWGESTVPSVLDMHVISQLTEHAFQKLADMRWADYSDLANELAELNYPVRLHITGGESPWTLTECVCCSECGLLCDCARECECAGGKAVSLREMLVSDYHAIAPQNIIDEYALVSRLTSEDVSGWEYGYYRTVSVAVQRSIASGN